MRPLILTSILLALACGPRRPPTPATDATDATGATLPGGYAPSQPIPMDPGVRHGTLDNGLRWFVEPNAVPDDRVVLRLVVDAGSILEDDDQLGLAHFVEHMAFNGTVNYPGNTLITELEGLGTRFGPHINAHTSFDETVYKLQLPTDDPEIVATGMQILRDWAGGLTFDADEVEKERGVVLEEWRQRLGAGSRLSDELLPLTYAGSPYPDRLPIGTEESLTGFEREALVRFYEDWYRPELMSVIVVGDVDAEAMQATIEELFADLEPAADPRERTRPQVTGVDTPTVKVVTDPEVPRASFSILQHEDWVLDATYGEFREHFVELLATSMLNMRLVEVAQRPGMDFLGAGLGRTRLTPTEGALYVGVGASEEALVPSLTQAWTEVVRARRHGFTAPELERARAVLLRGYASYLAEKDNTESAEHASELIRHVTTGENVPGVEHETELAELWVPGITLDEVNAWIASAFDDERLVVTATLPEKEGLEPPSGVAILAALEAVEASALDPWAEAATDSDPVVVEPEPGTILATDARYADDLGFTGWTLSNGVQVWFKRTDFKQDQVLFRGFSPGGHRMVADEDYVALMLADDVKRASGFGALSSAEMMKWMAGRQLSVGHSITPSWDKISGSAAPSDLGDALALLHQTLTDPRLTEQGRDEILEAQRAALVNRDSQPGGRFARAVEDAIWEESPRKHAWELDQVEAALSDVDHMRRLFADRFVAPDALTLVFVGNLPADFEQSVLRWVASLPTTEAAEAPPERTVERRPGPYEVSLEIATEDRASVGLSWRVPFEEQTWLSRNRLQAVDSVLSTLLREELREERGGVYGVGVSHDITESWPTPEASLRIGFSCDPERVDELVQAALAIVERVRTEPVDQRYIDEVLAKRARGREESLRSNSFWIGSFTGALRRGEDPTEILAYDERNASLTPEVVQEAAARFLPATEPEARLLMLPDPALVDDEDEHEDEAD